nr:hypothetical protein [Mesorhizobium sp.]
MQLYCRDGLVFASHEDWQVIPDGAYPADCVRIIVPDGFPLERVGPPPADGNPDVRPYAQPEINDAIRLAMPLEPWRFMAMLDIAGKRQAVDDAIGAMTDPVARAVARSRLNHSARFLRNDPLIDALSPLVGLTGAEIDGLWLQAVVL